MRGPCPAAQGVLEIAGVNVDRGVVEVDDRATHRGDAAGIAGRVVEVGRLPGDLPAE